METFGNGENEKKAVITENSVKQEAYLTRKNPSSYNRRRGLAQAEGGDGLLELSDAEDNENQGLTGANAVLKD